MKHIKIEHDADVSYNWQLDPALKSGAVLLFVASDVAPTFDECSTRGKPRMDYEREYWVVAEGTTQARYLEICQQAMSKHVTVGWSYDDAGIGDLTVRKVVLWDIPEVNRATCRDWYIANYHGTWVTFA